MMHSTATRAEADSIASVLVDLDEAAHILSCSRAMIYKLIASGKLRKVKIGRSARVRRADVLAFADV